MWIIGLAALVVSVGVVLICARRGREQRGYTVVAVDRVTEYSK